MVHLFDMLHLLMRYLIGQLLSNLSRYAAILNMKAVSSFLLTLYSSIKNLHLTIWICLTLKYSACSVKPDSDINIKQRNPPKWVILYKHRIENKQKGHSSRNL